MITGLVIELGGTVSFTDNSVLHFQGMSDDGVGLTSSSTGTEGYQASAEIHNNPAWEDILDNGIFVNSSWAIAAFALNPTVVATGKVINDLVLRMTIKMTTDGNNLNADYAFPPASPNPGLGTGKQFECAILYQNGSRYYSTTLCDAMITEIGDHPAALAYFQAALNAALEDVTMTIV